MPFLIVFFFLASFGLEAHSEQMPEDASRSAVFTGQMSHCADLMRRILSGFDKNGDPFYEAVELARQSVQRKEIFWWKNLLHLRILAFQTALKRGEPPFEGDSPLSLLSEDIQSARVENFAKYVERLREGGVEEKLTALNSFFLLATRYDTAEAALQQIEAALSMPHPEVNRYAYQGLWSLWIFYNRYVGMEDEPGWQEFANRVREIFSKSIQARIKVLKYDLENKHTLFGKSRTRMLKVLETSQGILSQNEAVALLAAIEEYINQASPEQQPMLLQTFESKWVYTKAVDDILLVVDLKAEKPDRLDWVKSFSPELLDLVQSVDEPTNFSARLYVTYLMEFIRDHHAQESIKIMNRYRQLKKIHALREFAKKENEKAAQKKRVAALFIEGKAAILSSLVEAITSDKFTAFRAALDAFLAKHKIKYSELLFPRSKDDPNNAIMLHEIAERLGLKNVADQLRSTYFKPQ